MLRSEQDELSPAAVAGFDLVGRVGGLGAEMMRREEDAEAFDDMEANLLMGDDINGDDEVDPVIFASVRVREVPKKLGPDAFCDAADVGGVDGGMAADVERQGEAMKASPDKVANEQLVADNADKGSPSRKKARRGTAKTWTNSGVIMSMDQIKQVSLMTF